MGDKQTIRRDVFRGYCWCIWDVVAWWKQRKFDNNIVLCDKEFQIRRIV